MLRRVTERGSLTDWLAGRLSTFVAGAVFGLSASWWAPPLGRAIGRAVS